MAQSGGGSGMRSCLMALGVGCLAVVVLGVACAGTGYIAVQRSIPPEPTPVVVEGDCPTDEVQAFLEGRDERAEAVLASFEGVGGSAQSPEDMAELLADVDMDAMRAARDETAAMDVPPCAVGARDAEVALYDLGIGFVEDLRDCGSGFCMAPVFFRMTTQLPPAIEQLDAAHGALAAEVGIEVESLEEILEDALGGNVNIEVN